MSRELINHTPGRLYPIAHPDPDWRLYVPGRLPDGTQALIGRLPPSSDPPAPGPRLVAPLVGLFFSPDGRFLRPEFLPIPFTYDPDWSPSRRGEFETRHQDDARSRWMADLGMTVATIRVLYFALPELRIAIADWPHHLFCERYAAARSGEDLATLDPENEDFAEWIEAGRFVLIWGSDFWMNADGTIGDS